MVRVDLSKYDFNKLSVNDIENEALKVANEIIGNIKTLNLECRDLKALKSHYDSAFSVAARMIDDHPFENIILSTFMVYFLIKIDEIVENFINVCISNYKGLNDLENLKFEVPESLKVEMAIVLPS